MVRVLKRGLKVGCVLGRGGGNGREWQLLTGNQETTDKKSKVREPLERGKQKSKRGRRKRQSWSAGGGHSTEAGIEKGGRKDWTEAQAAAWRTILGKNNRMRVNGSRVAHGKTGTGTRIHSRIFQREIRRTEICRKESRAKLLSWWRQ